MSYWLTLVLLQRVVDKTKQGPSCAYSCVAVQPRKSKMVRWRGCRVRHRLHRQRLLRGDPSSKSSIKIFDT